MDFILRSRVSYIFESHSFLLRIFITCLILSRINASFFCWSGECCDEDAITLNYTGLQEELDDSVFGQHLLKKTLVPLLKGHKNDPRRALVIAFHGWPGCGKTYVSEMIAKHMYRDGLNSKFVKRFIGSIDFPHPRKIEEYEDTVQETIKKMAKVCDRSLFIFDEVDDMPAGLIDTIRPFTDNYVQVDGVDYRKNVFLLLSNTGQENLFQLALKFWSDGKDREEIETKDVHMLIAMGAFNEKGGLQYTGMVRRSFISEYIPFFPLEKTHIKQCILKELNKRNMHAHAAKAEFVRTVADSEMYLPEYLQIYGKSGCRNIPEKN